jgi:hypothetical protein
MKTIFELLLRLQEMRSCCERTRRNPHLTTAEKAVASSHKQLVRECLPAEVLARYDLMKKTEYTMRECPEIFAMAVLVATWRDLSPAKRRKLAAHFAPPASSAGDGPTHRGNGCACHELSTRKIGRGSARRHPASALRPSKSR